MTNLTREQLEAARKPLTDDYVAWMRYEHYDEQPTHIMLCDSDEEGAFKVYRHPVIASEAYTRSQIIQAATSAYLRRGAQWTGANYVKALFDDLARLAHPKGEQRG